MNSQINISDISGVKYVPYKKVLDERGKFSKFYETGVLNDFAIEIKSVAISDNDKRGTVRGLHFQTSPFEESKIVACLSGTVFDVIVDLRPTSKTYRKWACVELSEQDSMCLFLPHKIAHGFQTLEEECSLLYLLSEIYSPKNSYSLNVKDQDLQIDWPLAISNLSDKDLAGISLQESTKVLENKSSQISKHPE
jgi:dTDP-4-dehydrorhamnose 3,5-epimerase